MISFRIDWFDLLAVQGTLKILSNTRVQRHQAQENKVCHCVHCFPIYLDVVMELDAIILLLEC